MRRHTFRDLLVSGWALAAALEETLPIRDSYPLLAVLRVQHAVGEWKKRADMKLSTLLNRLPQTLTVT